MAARAYLRWRTVRWALLAAPLLCAAVLYPIDGAYKSTDIAGYIPDDATWSVASLDAPAFWAGIEATPEYAAFVDELSRPLIVFERETHLRTGIRPTPSRWGLWMGDSVAISQRGDAFGFSVKPGVLVRGYHVFRTLLGAGADDGLFQLNDVYYRWHEGFLIASNDAAYFEGAWVARNVEPGATATIEDLSLDDELIRLVVTGAPGLPMTLELLSSSVAEDVAHEPIRQFPGDPILLVSTVSPGCIVPLWNRVRSLSERSEFLARLVHAHVLTKDMTTIPELPDDYLAKVKRMHLAVYELDTERTTFLPLGIVVTQTEEGATHPVSHWASGHEFEWEGVPGELAYAFRGWEELAWASEGNVHYTVTSEELMTQLMAEPVAEAAVVAPVAIAIDWAGVAQQLQNAARRLTKDDVEAPLDYADVEADIMPMVRAIAKLGRAEFTGRYEGETLVFEGNLASAESLADAADVDE